MAKLICSNFLCNTRIQYLPGTFNIWIKLSNTGVNERDERVLWVEKTAHSQKTVSQGTVSQKIVREPFTGAKMLNGILTLHAIFLFWYP